MAITWSGMAQQGGPHSTQGTHVSSAPGFYLDPDTKYQADTARRGQDLQQGRFNSIFPLLKGQFGSAFNADRSNIGGTPVIDRNPIYNPQQINQNVNAQVAQNNQATQTQQRLATQNIGGRGFGANSPLAQAIQSQLAGQNMATNAETERGTRMQAAEKNAGHRLGAQTAYEAAYSDRMRPWLQYQGQQQNALLAALSGLV